MVQKHAGRRQNRRWRACLAALPAAFVATPAPAAVAAATAPLALTAQPLGWLAVAIFVLAYLAVVFEEQLQLAKSKPVLLGAALIWGLLAWHSGGAGSAASDQVRAAFEHMFLEFAELFFFLVVAMTYVTAMGERRVFGALRTALTRRQLSFRQLFWLTGVFAFCLSPLIDNLTTALVMSAVVLAVGGGNLRFVSLSFINLVVAANAGGAWSAFGDITTLMVWQAHKVEFFEFFAIFLPSVVSWLVPALCMHFALPKGEPEADGDETTLKPGGIGICVSFALTIAITVAGKQWLGMPPVYGMLTGLALLNLVATQLDRRQRRYALAQGVEHQPYSIFRIIANAEWDTLLFFYGVLACVGGLAAMGFLELLSNELYGDLGYTTANVLMGILSAVVDNIPIMYAVLQMSPPMDHGQWLLITLTAGIGGSLLSIGSAAGVALMGASGGRYTFFGHLRWTWAIALGYAAGVATHLWING